MTINIKLDGSRLTVVDPCPILADGSKKTVKFRVEPDADWDGLTITVVFRRVHALGSEARSVVASNRAVEYDVPHEVLHDGWLYIGAAGVASSGTVKLTTAKLDRPIRVYESEDDAADPSGSITPEIADQILALIGTVSKLDTNDKSSIVAAINEVLGNIPDDYVTSVNNVRPQLGKVLLCDTDIDARIAELGYVGTIHGALSALLENRGLPVARGISADGIAYTATGDDLPTVSVAENMLQISAVGKGRQIVLIPMEKNVAVAPTLQINGGEIIPIRMRAPRNQGDNDDIPDATQPMWAGALMRGVPYTLTFCGKYWLLDSRISQLDWFNENILNRYANKLVAFTDSDTIAAPIINSTDEGIDNCISAMFIRRSTAENDTPDEDGNVTVPTEKRVAELIRKDSRLPIASGESSDGIVYAATGDYLPDVNAGSQGTHIGKGSQVVLIPKLTNTSNTPTLQLNDGDAIPIRMRAPKNQGISDDSPNATLPVPVGALMVGVPYTLTFCGLYWLVDSMIYSGIPLPTAEDAGKVLTVDADGAAVWTAVTNAEEVGF